MYDFLKACESDEFDVQEYENSQKSEVLKCIERLFSNELVSFEADIRVATDFHESKIRVSFGPHRFNDLSFEFVDEVHEPFTMNVQVDYFSERDDASRMTNEAARALLHNLTALMSECENSVRD